MEVKPRICVNQSTAAEAFRRSCLTTGQASLALVRMATENSLPCP